MTQDQKVINNLEKMDMHVKSLGNDNIGKHLVPTDTHYVMQGAAIVHVGNLKTVAHFALQQGA